VSDHGRDDLALRGRAALVTGVSRRAGIGFAIARRLAGAGASIFAHHHVPHDAERRWGASVASGPLDAWLQTSMSTGSPKRCWTHRLIEWLVSDDGRWMTGQVLNSEGGFRRWASPAD
jgi:NAD(P)-dependent dehydrogenase (short-subunit alcohol dehydrogenase family)